MGNIVDGIFGSAVSGALGSMQSQVVQAQQPNMQNAGYGIIYPKPLIDTRTLEQRLGDKISSAFPDLLTRLNPAALVYHCHYLYPLSFRISQKRKPLFKLKHP